MIKLYQKEPCECDYCRRKLRRVIHKEILKEVQGKTWDFDLSISNICWDCWLMGVRKNEDN